jgi:hypothetical protein
VFEGHGMCFDLVGFFEVERSSSVLDVGDTRVGGPREVENLKAAGHAGMCATSVGHDLNGDLRMARHGSEVQELIFHHGGVAHDAT